MEFMIDKKSFKLKRALRIILFTLLSLCLLSLLVALYYIFQGLVVVPIIMSVLIGAILTLLVLILFRYDEKSKDLVYKLDGDTLSTKDYSINLSKIYKLSVYSSRDRVYKIRIWTGFDSITIDRLNDDGLNQIINRIMEVKNGKDI